MCVCVSSVFLFARLLFKAFWTCGHPGDSGGRLACHVFAALRCWNYPTSPLSRHLFLPATKVNYPSKTTSACKCSEKEVLISVSLFFHPANLCLLFDWLRFSSILGYFFFSPTNCLAPHSSFLCMITKFSCVHLCHVPTRPSHISLYGCIHIATFRICRLSPGGLQFSCLPFPLLFYSTFLVWTFVQFMVLIHIHILLHINWTLYKETNFSHTSICTFILFSNTLCFNIWYSIYVSHSLLL